MKICTTLILLTLLCPGGCPVYDFDVKTIEQPIQFSDDLKWQADLNQEMTQNLFGRKDDTEVAQYDRNNIRNDDNTFNRKNTEEETKDVSNTELEESDMKLQRECNDGKNKNSKSKLDFVGTNLFDGTRKKCFTNEEVALLTARRDFDMLLPKDLPQCLLNDEMVSVYMQYFFGINQVIQRMNDDCSKTLTEKAFYDTLGGYLKYYVLPVTKYSYYAGKVSLKTVDNVVALYQQCKNLLNTNGNGWKPPMENVLTELKNVHIKPMRFDCKKNRGADKNNKQGCVETGQNESEESSYCTNLDLSCINSDTEEDQMIVALPKLEAEDCDGFLGNIWLPFKRKRTFNLRSRKSAFVVVKFFETVTRCYRFQCLSQDAYNAKFKAWIVENIQVHLADEVFYPGLGAILRISENLKREKKAAYDNDYEDEPSIEETPSYDMTNNSPKHTRAELSNESDWKHGKRIPCKKPGKENNKENNKVDEGEMPDDDSEMAGQFKVKVDCPIMPFAKKKHKKTHNHKKIECKKPPPVKQCKKEPPKPKPWYIAFMDWITQKHIMDYLCWFIFFLIILLLLILLCAMLKKRKRKPKPPPPPPPEPVKEKEPSPPPPEPKKKGGLCGCFRKKSHDDDEMYVKPDSASVQPQPARRKMVSSSSSALAFKTVKCIPINKKLTRAGRDSDKSDAPIITTTSMDYSSSEPEEKTFKNDNKPKIVTVDERKKNNRRQSNNSASKTPRIGLQRNSSTSEAEVKSNNKRLSETDRRQTESDRRQTESDRGRSETDQRQKSNPRDKHHSTSWETVYET